MKWYLRACPVCGGDAHDDPEDAGWVTCFMCTRSFPAALLTRRLEVLAGVREAPEAIGRSGVVSIALEAPDDLVAVGRRAS